MLNDHAERVHANGQNALQIRSTASDGRVTLGGTETLRDRPDILELRDPLIQVISKPTLLETNF